MSWPSAPVVYEVDTWPWLTDVRTRLGAPAATLGGPLPQLAGTPTDPLQQVAALQGVTEARLVGPEPVDGTPTTHYAATVDLLATPAAADPAQRPAIDRLVAQIGTNRLPTDCWVDEQGLLRFFHGTGFRPAPRFCLDLVLHPLP